MLSYFGPILGCEDDGTLRAEGPPSEATTPAPTNEAPW